MLLQKLSKAKRAILLSSALLAASCFLITAILSYAVQPHSVADLLIPATVELRDDLGQVVYTQKSRLNTMVIPDSLRPGLYGLYVNGQYKDSIQVAERISSVPEKPESRNITQIKIKNIDGGQAITWMEEKANDFSFFSSPVIQKAILQTEEWKKQQKALFSEIDGPLFAGAVLMGLMLMTFNITALTIALARSDEDMINFFKNGLAAFPYTIITSVTWTLALAGISAAAFLAAGILGVPYQENIKTGIFFFAAAFVLYRIASVVVGPARKEVLALYPLACSLAGGILAGILAADPVAFALLLVIIMQVLTSAVAIATALPEPDDRTELKEGKNEAWREALL